MTTYTNPTTPLRAALITYCRANVAGDTYVDKLPKDRSQNTWYIILTSQTKNTTERSKCGFEWLCTVDFDIYNVSALGFASYDKVDELEGQIIQGVENGINVVDFYVKDVELINSIDLPVETETNSIQRRVLTYQFWIWEQ